MKCTNMREIFNDIILGQEEAYDATRENCWSFLKSTDIRDGISLKLGNLWKGFPFTMCGIRFDISETAYLCGEFSLNTEECIDVQRMLIVERNGYSAKRTIKMGNAQYVRSDWEEMRLSWMLYVLWRKSCENADFANILRAIPEDAVIIEDCTPFHDETSDFWGARNEALQTVRRAKEEELRRDFWYMEKEDVDAIVNIEVNKINAIGVWRGQNNLGKAIKLCQIALLHDVDPPIDYGLLRSKEMYILGERIDDYLPKEAMTL